MDRFDTARALVLAAGARLRLARPEAGAVWEKTGHQDLVTRCDRETEQFLRSGILSAFPGDAIVGEEYPATPPGGTGCVWYLDPIDGTTNFVSQHRNYAVSVGCYQDGVPAFGLVLDVERGALYSARHGGGALRDETPIHVSHCGVLRDALLTTPGVLHTFLREHPRRAGLVELAGAVRGVRSMGCVALELCAVSMGPQRGAHHSGRGRRLYLCAGRSPSAAGHGQRSACGLFPPASGTGARRHFRKYVKPGERLTHRLPGRGRATAPTYSGPCTPPKQPPGLL